MTRNVVARAAGALTVALSFGVVAAAQAGAATPAAAPAAAGSSAASASPPKYQWTEPHENPQLTGVSGDPTINTSNAADLGVKWMTNLAGTSLTSPIVGYNAQLGETLVYAGSESGWFSAFNEHTGKTVWSVDLGSAVRMTPTLDGPYIWVADTYSPELYKLNAATGAEQCSTPIYAVAEASPVVVTPPGGVKTVYMGSNDLAQSGPLYAIKEANCAVEWSFDNYKQTSGLWDFISYGVDAPTTAHPQGEPLIVFGTADPDAGVYALDAVTGKEVWRFQTYNPDDGPADIGAGVTISPPGNNGFADGVAYVPSKDGKMYALDLTTGAKIWVANFESFPPVGNGSRDTAALSGDNLVFASTVGVFDYNAITGAQIWEYAYPTLPNEGLGAPAIAGPPGEQVVYAPNVNGQFQVLSLATGALVYQYQTTNYLASSPAVVSGNVLLTAANGFLYDFALGGSQPSSTPPATAVTSPAAGSTVANPDDTNTKKPPRLVISGTATANDPSGVKKVLVTVQEDGGSGQWWSNVDDAWVPGVFDNPATVATPGAATSTWTLKVPVPARGTTLEVRAATVDGNGQADTTSDGSASSPSRVDFTVAPSTVAPTLQLSAARVAPGTDVTVSGGGYQAGEKVAITLPTNPVSTLATLTATPGGALSPTAVAIPVKIPPNDLNSQTGLPFGPITMSATGETSGNVGSATFVVSNNWDQFGGDASKTNFEENDLALTDNVAASGRFYFDMAYNFPTFAKNGIESTPAIDNGTAFFGDSAGDFWAIDVSSGQPAWEDAAADNTTTYVSPANTIDSSGGIDSSAAVDPKLVIGGHPEPAVFFGTEADSSGSGSVTAVNESTGDVLWSTPTTSAVESSPALYNGTVYVATDDGTFYALDEQTGAVEWTQTLNAVTTPGSPQSSPAIDDSVAHPSVVVGDGDDVTAMNLTTGAILWTEEAGGLVTATPTYFSNNIYVGSQDGTEYAFNGTTGAPVWTFATGGSDPDNPTPGAGGPIVANNVTFGTDLAVGSMNGYIYYLTSTASTTDPGHPAVANYLPPPSTEEPDPPGIVGLAGAVNFAVATLSDGDALATRITGIDQTWKYAGDDYGFDSSPVLNNGNVYLTGLDGNMYAFTAPGHPVY